MAVYTDVNDSELKPFIATYGLGNLVSYKGIAEGVENTNYYLATTTGRYILTLYEQRVDRNDLPFFLGLLDHLATQGIACPTPVRTIDGAQVSELAGRAAAIVTFLEGFCIHQPEPGHCHGVGQTLARLHLAGQGYALHRVNALGQSGWQPLYASLAGRADEIQTGLAEKIELELCWLGDHWPSELPSGVIHADLFPDNVFFLQDELSGLIDFYFACNDAYALDVAITLNAWCFDKASAFSLAHARALLKGYQSIRPLSKNEAAAFPVLCRGAAMRFLLTRSYDWLNTKQDALVRLHNPIDYLERLQFHQQVTDPLDYGLIGA